MENSIVSDIEVFLEANKDSKGRLLVVFGKDVIHRSKADPLEVVITRLYGLMQSLSEEPVGSVKRYVDFNSEGVPVFIPFNLLRSSLFQIEVVQPEATLH